MFDDLSETALSRLAHGQIVTVVLQDGAKRDAIWNKHSQGFSFCDGLGNGFVPHKEVYEWWPAGAKF